MSDDSNGSQPGALAKQVPLANDSISNSAGVVSKDPGAPALEAERRAGRGGLAITAAKLWFIVAGFVQQTVLPRIIGLDGYGAFALVQAVANIPNNVVTTASIQGVSRAVASAGTEGEASTQRRALRIHAVLAPCIALAFFSIAPFIAQFEYAPHITRPLRVFAWTLLVYGLYTPLVGAINGRRRFTAQAGLDVTFATLRTVGLLLGAYLLGRKLDGATGAAIGMALAATAILPFALVVSGLGKSGPSKTTVATHLRVLWPIALSQTALNLLMQADIWLLARFAHQTLVRADVHAVATLEQTGTMVGAYRAAQLFAFLPVQLLTSITFVLFPMIAQAHAKQDHETVTRLVRTGFRIALVLAGAMVSCVAALGPQLLRFAFPPAAAEYAGDALRVLALGQGAFALFSLQTTVLVSLGRERTAALLTISAATLVAIFCTLLARSAPFGPTLLLRTSTATALALLTSVCIGGVLVWRAAGGFVSSSTLARTLLAVACAVVLGTRLPWLGRIAVLPEAALVLVVYLAVAIASKELTRNDLAILKRVLGRKKTTPTPS